jgi:hypothetical protein
MKGAVEQQWGYLEPLLTVQQLKDRFLFGLPLVSGIKDPITHKNAVMTDDLISDTVNRAVAMVEADCSICIFPQIIKENQAFDRNEYLSWGFFRTEKRPIAGIHQISVVTSTQTGVFILPAEWIETGRLKYGQVNIIPFTSALGSGTMPQATSAGGSVILMLLANRDWVPSFWQLEYTCGFPDALLPKLVNEIVGTKSAMEVLSMLAATYARTTSQSLGIDSLSQSSSGPGPQIYMQRLTELEKKYEQLKHKIKTMFGMVLFSGNV